MKITKTFGRGNYIINEEPSKYLYQLVAGSATLEHTTKEGTRRIHYIYVPEDFIGLNSFFGRPEYAQIRARDNCICVGQEIKHLNHDDKVLHLALEQLLREREDMFNMESWRDIKSPSDKVKRFIDFYNKKGVIFHNQYELSSAVFVCRESVSRSLNK